MKLILSDVPGRKAVRRAGEAMRDGDFGDEALDAVSRWRLAHAYPLELARAILTRRLHALGIGDALTAMRLKRLPSIALKLRRFDGMCLDRMQDIGGIRVIVGSVEEAHRLEDALLQGRCRHDLPDPHDYISHPKSDGYRGIHQIFRIRSIAHPELDGLAVELQIRTRLEHSWATAVEAMDFISGSSLKSGGGDEDARRFFALSSALFALEEKAPLPSYAEGMAREDLAAALARLEQSSGLLARLEGQAIASGHVEEPCRNIRGWRVMLLDTGARRLCLTPFIKAQLPLAGVLYAALERRFMDDSGKAAVLISSGDLKEIRKAYPNYFLDASAFTRRIRRIARQGARPARR